MLVYTLWSFRMGDQIGKIFLVEDDFTKKVKLLEALSSEGFAVSSAAAKEGDAVLPKIIDAKPDIIITDVDTSDFDPSLGLVDKIKGRPELKGAEIFVYTKKLDVGLEVRLRRIKVKEYFMKEDQLAPVLAAAKRFFVKEEPIEYYDPYELRDSQKYDLEETSHPPIQKDAGSHVSETDKSIEDIAKKTAQFNEARRKAEAEHEAKKLEQQMLEEARRKAEAELEAKKREQQMLEEANRKALAELEAKKREHQMLEEARQRAETELEAKKREQQMVEEARRKTEAELEAKKREQQRLDEDAKRKAETELEAKKREQQMLEEANRKAMAELEAKKREQQMLEEAGRKAETELKAKKLEQQKLDEDAKRKAEAELEAKKLEQQRLDEEARQKAEAELEAKLREHQMLEEARRKADAELEAKNLEQQKLETKKPPEEQAASKPKPEKPFKIIPEGVSVEDANSSYNLGLGYMDLGLLNDAAKEFSRAASDPKLRRESLMFLGVCLRKLKDYTSAIQCFAEARKSSAKNEELTELHYETGITFEQWGKLQEALDSYKLVIKSDKSFRDVETRVYELRKAIRSSQGG